jgi:hypothetical protein
VDPIGWTGGAGGSGIVIVKELNKASGSWPLRAQFSARKSGTWPEFLVNIDYLVVAGGGAGGGISGGGGGGAGGYRASGFGPAPLQGTVLELVQGTYPVTVGGGGAVSGCAGLPGNNGSPSEFATIIATGGGGGGGVSTPPQGLGSSGGSGGGGGVSNFNISTGGSGNSPPTSPPQGNPGGDSAQGIGGGAGGGGATAAGGNSPAPKAGGAGAPNNISGCAVTYAAGGSVPGSVGGSNTGNGGGGQTYGCSPAFAGGSGIVIVRAPGSVGLAASPGTNTVTTLPAPAGGCKVATFTVSGDLTIS